MLKNNQTKKLVVLGILMEMIYLLFYFVEPLRKFLGDDKITLNNSSIFLSIVLLLLLLVSLYMLAFKQIRRNKNYFHPVKRAPSAGDLKPPAAANLLPPIFNSGVPEQAALFNEIKILFAFIVIFSATCLFLWPIGSADIFTYVNQTKILSAHNANPYTTPYSSFPNDELYYFVNTNWAENTSPYGPLFVFIGGALSFACNNNLILTLFIFKLFFVLIHILNCLLIYKIFKDGRALLLYGWNPIIVYEFAINGH